MADMREEADSNYYFGEVKIWHDSSRRKGAGVVVEGKSDERLFGKFFKRESVFFCFDGFEDALGTMQQVERHGIPGIVCIVDADFRRITGRMIPIPNVLMTDKHDAEMMLLASEAWQQILEQFAETRASIDKPKPKLEQFEDLKAKPLLDCLLDAATPLACVRLLNSEKNLDLRFKQKKKDRFNYLDFSIFVEKESLDVDIDKMFRAIENKSNKPMFFSNNPQLKEEYLGYMAQGHDQWELCNGHDVLHLFSLALESAVSNKKSSSKMDPRDLESHLSVAYRIDDFRRTQLYKDLKSWEFANSYNLFRN